MTTRPLPHSSAITRRGFVQKALSTVSGIAAYASLSRVLLGAAKESGPSHENHLGEYQSLLKPGHEKVLILIYPGFTALDAIGPQYMLSSMAGSQVRFVAKTKMPVRCDTGFEVVPQLSFGEVTEKPTLFVVPGGMQGTLNAIEDAETLDFVRRMGNSSEMIASVCTGSLILGAAGLLKGYQATSHWQTLDLLPLVGAIPSTNRVVFDRNRITGAGVTAGLDLGLELVRHYRGDFYTKGVELLAQYDPNPPFLHEGNPQTADPKIVEMFQNMHRPFIDSAASTIKKAYSLPTNP
jgi:putative intracellular protease/amidase